VSSATSKNKHIRLTDTHIAANAQVGKMREGFDKYKNKNANAKKYFEAAFRKKGDNVNPDKVEDVIKQLEKGQVKAEVGTAKFTDKIASTPWTKLDKKTDGKDTPWTPGPLQFGSQFHGTISYLM
jgi:hypothetical protein